jgi:hypothetical protein
VVPAGGKGEPHGLAVALVKDGVGDWVRLDGKDLVHWDCPLWDVEGVAVYGVFEGEDEVGSEQKAESGWHEFMLSASRGSERRSGSLLVFEGELKLLPMAGQR